MSIVQQRIDELVSMRQRLLETQIEDGKWDWFLNKEIIELEQKKNARLAGRTLGLRTRLKSLMLLILSPSARESKGEGA
ncbi:hypothetical protein [Paenibacillus peoriae]|uniref:hypothetical protein n=1 Tax=Paenibacillus peoriae TaxID=59893 RepID=UPI00096CF584|nr:hypothetical protein [Paenibacillus peoriae]OMF40353.1 hypothetical protein BK135_23200 [Paenibacillus peoriae]